jgi:hypothetical protein
VLWLLHLAAETSGAVFTPADLRDTYRLHARRAQAQRAQRFGGTTPTARTSPTAAPNAASNLTPSNVSKMEDHR